jgi:hypothetical protein
VVGPAEPSEVEVKSPGGFAIYWDRLARVMTVLFAVLFSAQSTLAQDDLEVEFLRDQGMISVHAVEVPFDEVLDAIGEAAGIGIIRHATDDTPVTLDVVGVPVKIALKRLLGRGNYAMKEDPQTNLPVQIWVMSTASSEAIARMRQAQRSREEARAKAKETSERASHQREATDSSEIWQDLRSQLQAPAEGEPDHEILKNLGLTREEREELLRMLDKMEAGDD